MNNHGMNILVTGGAGFIGSNFVELALGKGFTVGVVDCLTYAGSFENFTNVKDDPEFHFFKEDIVNKSAIEKIFKSFSPTFVVNFAAESHVDRSILSSDDFVRTNVMGTHSLLMNSVSYYKDLSNSQREIFRYLQVSTDEVFGSLELGDPGFKELDPFRPNNPYSASKAGGDHLVRSFHETFKLPTLTTHCSNNYGIRQHPEKLIPTMIRQALNTVPLTVYGDGKNRRDWLHVEDHCDAIFAVLEHGDIGDVYNIGGGKEISNLEIVNLICQVLNEEIPASAPYEGLISYVKDREGHDFRYAIDCSKMKNKLKWQAKKEFHCSMRDVIRWNINNQDRLNTVLESKEG
jgi:dTDP-glucose 4,6-dehydratase